MNGPTAPAMPPNQLPLDRPSPSIPPISLYHCLQVHLEIRLITASNFERSSPPIESLRMLVPGLRFRTILASNCVSALAWSLPPSVDTNLPDHGLLVRLQSHTITASMFTKSWPPQVCLQTCLDSIIRRTSNYSQAMPADSPDILCVYELVYWYIDT